jgi:hypothetical protein
MNNIKKGKNINKRSKNFFKIHIIKKGKKKGNKQM